MSRKMVVNDIILNYHYVKPIIIVISKISIEMQCLDILRESHQMT